MPEVDDHHKQCEGHTTALVAATRPMLSPFMRLLVLLSNDDALVPPIVDRIAVALDLADHLNLSLVHRCFHRRLQSVSVGNSLLQRYWFNQHFLITWDTPLDRGQRCLEVPLTKESSKRRWKDKFMEEYEAHLSRTRGGHLRCNRNVALASRAVVVECLSTALSVVSSKVMAEMDAAARGEVQQRLNDRRDVKFVQLCREGGVDAKHFSQDDPNGLDGPSEVFHRGVYKTNTKAAKRKGKHRKGDAKQWGSWDADQNYDY